MFISKCNPVLSEVSLKYEVVLINCLLKETMYKELRKHFNFYAAKSINTPIHINTFVIYLITFTVNVGHCCLKILGQYVPHK